MSLLTLTGENNASRCSPCLGCSVCPSTTRSTTLDERSQALQNFIYTKAKIQAIQESILTSYVEILSVQPSTDPLRLFRGGPWMAAPARPKRARLAGLGECRTASEEEEKSLV